MAIYDQRPKAPPPWLYPPLWLWVCGCWVAEVIIIGFPYVLQPRCSERSQLRNGLRIRLTCFISQNHMFSLCFSYILKKVRTLDGAEALNH